MFLFADIAAAQHALDVAIGAFVILKLDVTVDMICNKAGSLYVNTCLQSTS